MPIYTTQVFKSIGAETWQNGYRFSATNNAEALIGVEALATAEAGFHSDQVQYQYARVSDVAAGPGTFMTIPFSFTGVQPPGNTGELLPLFNVARLDMSTGFGRPDYKLYRGCLGEGNSGNGLIGTTLRTQITNAIDAFLSIVLTDFWLVDGADDPFNNLDVDQFIRQRDLHRRKRRAPSGTLQIP